MQIKSNELISHELVLHLPSFELLEMKEMNLGHIGILQTSTTSSDHQFEDEVTSLKSGFMCKSGLSTVVVTPLQID